MTTPFPYTAAAKRGRAAVLRILIAAHGQWVDGEKLIVGGHEGTRRARELRAQQFGGHLIQRRPHPFAGGRWQYRLPLPGELTPEQTTMFDDGWNE